MSKFVIDNGERKVIAEIVTGVDGDSDLRLRINGQMILYVTEDGRIEVMRDVAAVNGDYSFKLCKDTLGWE